MRIDHSCHRVWLGLLLPGALTLAACTAGQPDAVPQRDAGERQRVLAPIDDARVDRSGRDAPHYVLHVTSGLPSGCARFDGLEKSRDGSRIAVSIWNTVPADPQVACTMVYGTHNSRLDLGGDFQPGTRYRVEINGDYHLEFEAE